MLGAVILLLLVVSCVVVVTSRETKSALVVVLIGDEQQEAGQCLLERSEIGAVGKFQRNGAGDFVDSVGMSKSIGVSKSTNSFGNISQ